MANVSDRACDLDACCSAPITVIWATAASPRAIASSVDSNSSITRPHVGKNSPDSRSHSPGYQQTGNKWAEFIEK